MPKHKKNRLFLPLGLILLGILIFAGLFLYLFVTQRILPHISINGYDVGGKNANEAQETLKQYTFKTQEIGPEVIFNNHVFKPKLAELGFEFDTEMATQNALNYGRQGNFSAKLKQLLALANQNVDFPLSGTFNEATLNQYLKNISNLTETKAQNASLKIVDGEIVAAISKEGFGLNKNKFKNELLNQIDQGEIGQINLQAETILPQISDEGILEAKTDATAFLAKTPFDLVVDKDSYTINQQDVANWIVFNADGAKLKAEIDENKIRAYLKPIEEKYFIAKVDEEVLGVSNQVVKAGRNGQMLDEKTAIATIKSQLGATNTKNSLALGLISVEKGKKIITPAFEPGKFEGRYIDVNLTEQKLRLVESSKLMAEYPVSTGKWSTPTPVGTRYIENKIERAWSKEYGLYMPWWNSLGGGYGIHELPEWPNGYKEGAGHLGTPVSHGCIRLGVGPAKEVYDWAPVGTPVYIHK